MSKTNEKYTNEEILSLKEAVQHGDFLLPFDIYRTRMPEYFNSFPMHWHEEIEIVLKADMLNLTLTLKHMLQRKMILLLFLLVFFILLSNIMVMKHICLL
mgnify:CR=1 FL=1